MAIRHPKTRHGKNRWILAVDMDQWLYEYIEFQAKKTCRTRSSFVRYILLEWMHDDPSFSENLQQSTKGE